MVRGFLGRLTRGSPRVDDLAQDAFLTAWTRAESWRGEGSWRGWVLKIAWRSFLMDERSSARRLPAWRGEGVAPEQAAANDAERDLILEDALSRLSAEDRAAVVLCLSLGHSHSEAASILGMPLGTVKTRVARGSRQLVQILGDEG